MTADCYLITYQIRKQITKSRLIMVSIFKIRSIVATAALASSFIAAGAIPSKAATLSCSTGCDLASLISNGDSLLAGGKTFSNFSATFIGDGNISPTQTSTISIIGGSGGNFDLRIQSLFAAFSNSVNDVLLGFDVESAAGTKINSVGLAFNGAVRGTALAEVVETIDDVAGNRLGQTDVSAVTANGVQSNVPTSSVILSQAARKISVTKDIGLLALTNKSSATISVIDQKFGTVPDAVPSPALLPGLVGMGVAALRKRKQAAEAE